MALRRTMPIRQDPRPGAGDERHRTDYDPARGWWGKTPPPADADAKPKRR